MNLKRIFALLLVLVTAAALAESAIESFAGDYNYYAPRNNAPLIDTRLAEQEDGDWIIHFDGKNYALCVSLDKDGYVELLMLDTECGNEEGLRAFLNAWFVADSSVEYDDIYKLVSGLIAGGKDATDFFQGWFVAYQYTNAADSDTGTARDMVGIVWAGDDGADVKADEIPFPDVTPAPSVKQTEPETYMGKPIYKA